MPDMGLKLKTPRSRAMLCPQLAWVSLASAARRVLPATPLLLLQKLKPVQSPSSPSGFSLQYMTPPLFKRERAWGRGEGGTEGQGGGEARAGLTPHP